MPPPVHPIVGPSISALPRTPEAASAARSLPAHLAFLRTREQPLPPPGRVLAFGDARLDGCLAQGGLALGALHEVAASGIGAETGALPAAFIALLAARLPSRRPVLWVARRDDLHAPGIPHLDPARLILARAGDDAAVLGVMETALRGGGLAAVVGEVGAWGQAGARVATRRLQLACQAHAITAFALRRWPFGGQAEDREASAASTSWCLAPAPSGNWSRNWGGNWGPARWRLDLRHARAGRPGTWMVEASHDTPDPATPAFRVVAALADHAAAPAADPRPAAGHG